MYAGLLKADLDGDVRNEACGFPVIGVVAEAVPGEPEEVGEEGIVYWGCGRELNAIVMKVVAVAVAGYWEWLHERTPGRLERGVEGHLSSLEVISAREPDDRCPVFENHSIELRWSSSRGLDCDRHPNVVGS